GGGGRGGGRGRGGGPARQAAPARARRRHLVPRRRRATHRDRRRRILPRAVRSRPRRRPAGRPSPVLTTIGYTPETQTPWHRDTPGPAGPRRNGATPLADERPQLHEALPLKLSPPGSHLA